MESRRGKNYCWRCIRFARWDQLVPASAGGWIHAEPCNLYEITEATRKKPRCPECKHGQPAGHRGRSCLAMVPYYNYEYNEYDYCGCDYRNKELEKPLRKGKKKNV